MNGDGWASTLDAGRRLHAYHLWARTRSGTCPYRSQEERLADERHWAVVDELGTIVGLTAALKDAERERERLRGALEEIVEWDEDAGYHAVQIAREALGRSQPEKATAQGAECPYCGEVMDRVGNGCSRCLEIRQAAGETK